MQVVWHALPTRRATIGLGEHSADVEAAAPAWLFRRWGGPRRLSPLPGGPGSVVIDGLAPDTTYPLWLQPEGMARRQVGRVRTLAPPPGALLCRFATISDLHIGERAFGAADGIIDVTPRAAGLGPYPKRCAEAALAEAKAWGAQLVVAKGDLTNAAWPAEVEAVAALLGSSKVPVLAQLGNHDVQRDVDLGPLRASVRLAGPDEVLVEDLSGIRLVLGDSPIRRHRWGGIDRRHADALADALATAGGPAALLLHHAPQQGPVPTHYPPGIIRTDSRRLVEAVKAANPATVILAGHTHRNRTYPVAGVLVAEVGSTKDYPGGWAGYAVHEGGIRQVVRRSARPDVLAWTEATRRALAGLWGWWSPGSLADRCWSYTWPVAPT